LLIDLKMARTSRYGLRAIFCFSPVFPLFYHLIQALGILGNILAIPLASRTASL